MQSDGSVSLFKVTVKAVGRRVAASTLRHFLPRLDSLLPLMAVTLVHFKIFSLDTPGNARYDSEEAVLADTALLRVY